MQSLYLKLSVIFIVILHNFIDSTLAQNSYTVGNRGINDELIQNEIEEGRGSPGYISNYSKTYAGNNHHIITQVSIEDLTRFGGAYAAIIAGGPDHTFVTLSYTIPRYVDMKYNVTIYGKIPAFRKIP